jgi:putative flippase GtrA
MEVMEETIPAVAAAPGWWVRQIDAIGAALVRLPRLIRFGGVGGACAVLQLAALAVLVRLGVNKHLGNGLAFFGSTQVNFVLSSLITWRERRGREVMNSVVARMASYNLLALGVLVVNQVVFALAASRVHYLIASALGILAGMVVNYTVSRAVVFRSGQ